MDRDDAAAPPAWSAAGSGLAGRSVGQVAIWVAAALVFLAALATRVGLLNAPPHFDELYHLLAARGWLETGTPSILDGQYTRGAAYTRAVAWIFEVTGQSSLSTGRLASLLPGTLLPVAVFLWVRAMAGWLAAAVAVLFVITWPQGIVEAQFLRFYSAQVLLFLIGAIAVYEATGVRGGARVAWAMLGAGALWGACKLQITSAIGVLGILGWLAGLVLLRHPALDGRRLRVVAVLTGIAVVVLAGLWASGALDRIWAYYRWVPAHSTGAQDYVTFYHHNLRAAYGGFWSFFPLAAIVAFRANARLAAFCITIFVTAVVLQSFGGMKAVRYLSYAMPFFFILWGLAIAAMLPVLVGMMQEIGWPRVVTGGVLVASLLYVAAGHRFVPAAARLALGQPPDTREDWQRLPQVLGDWSTVPFRITTHELHTVAYLGDYGLLVSPSRRSELPVEEDFGIDPRTGRPVVASSEALRRVVACKRDGVLISSRTWFEADPLGRALAEVLAEDELKVETRADGPFRIVRWSDPAARAPDCTGWPAG